VSSTLSPTTTFVLEHWSFLMLVFVPIGITAPYLGCNDFAVFVLNCLAIIPLADVLCRATDKVASFLGETAGALVNVTMGNVAELAIFMYVTSPLGGPRGGCCCRQLTREPVKRLASGSI
jgi:Ca2+/H+ antiporter